MKKLKFSASYILLALFIISNLVAQEESSTAARTKSVLSDVYRNEATKWTTIRTFNSRFRNVKGSPFFSDEYNFAVVYYGNTLKPAEGEIKYDIYEDEIICKDKLNREIILIKENIDSFALWVNDIEYRFNKIDIGTKKSIIQYACKLLDGKACLYKAYKKRFVKADNQGAYSTGNDYDEFIPEEHYFIMKPDGNVQKINLRKGSILRALADKNNDLKNYIKTNKLDLRNIEEVTRLIDYYNSL